MDAHQCLVFDNLIIAIDHKEDDQLHYICEFLRLEGEDISIAEDGTSPHILESGTPTQVLQHWEDIDDILDFFDLQFGDNSGNLAEEGEKTLHDLWGANSEIIGNQLLKQGTHIGESKIWKSDHHLLDYYETECVDRTMQFVFEIINTVVLFLLY